MKPLLVLALLLGGCAPQVATPDPASRLIPTGAEPDRTEWAFDQAIAERDLLVTARARLGEATVRRALAAHAYIFAKSYAGMLPPPPPDAGPDWRYPLPPFTLLFHENGQWMVARNADIRPARPAPIAEIRAILADKAFWRQPQAAGPGCTDAGASLVMLKMPGRAEAIRRGTCGETELTQRLVSLAHDA